MGLPNVLFWKFGLLMCLVKDRPWKIGFVVNLVIYIMRSDFENLVRNKDNTPE
jgi:hypothetical protein